MKKTLYKYLIREQIVPLGVCFFGLSLILIMGRLLQLTRYLFTSSVTVGDLAAIMAFAMPNLVLYALPMATLVGVLLAFVRLNSDNELVALRAAGIGFHQFFPAIISLLVITTVSSFLNVVCLMPSANRAFEIKLKSLGRSILPVLLKEGTFIDIVPKIVFFFKSVDAAHLKIEGVFVQDNRQPEVGVVIVADHAQIAYPPDLSQLIFKISSGMITRVADDLRNAQAITFKNYDLALSMDELFGASSRLTKGRREMNLSELRMKMREKGPDYEVSYALEFHRRLALPLSCLLLGLVGAPLGAMFRQSGRMAGITLGLGVFLTYYIVLSAGKGLGENGIISPFLAVWLPNLLTTLVAVLLWVKVQREIPLDLGSFCRNWPLPGSSGSVLPLLPGILSPDMKIISRYMLKHFFPVFGLALGAIVGLYLVIDFFEKVDNLLEKHVDAAGILSYFMLKLPFIVTQAIPMAALLASLVAIGILKRNRELIALETAGIRAASYAAPILLTALGLSLVHLLVDETLARAMNQKAQQIWQSEVLNQKASLAWSHENVWYRGQHGIYQIRLYNKDQQSLERVSLFYLNREFQLTERLDAKRVRWQDQRWIAEDGLILRFTESRVDQEWFAERPLALAETPADFARLETIPEELNWLDLYHYTHKIRTEGYNARPYEVELHMRLAMPLTTFIVALLGVTIALSQGLHGGLAVGLGVALVVASLYFLVLHLGTALATAGILPALVGVWAGDIIFATLAGYLWTVRVR